MELSFAIKTIKTEKEMNLYGNGYFICDTKAIDTVLKALEDSIPKEKVREIIEDIDETDAGDYIDAIQDLQELLGE